MKNLLKETEEALAQHDHGWKDVLAIQSHGVRISPERFKQLASFDYEEMASDGSLDLGHNVYDPKVDSTLVIFVWGGRYVRKVDYHYNKDHDVGYEHWEFIGLVKAPIAEWVRDEKVTTLLEEY